MANRFEWGPAIGPMTFLAAPDAPVERSDVVPTYEREKTLADPSGTIHFTVPAHDPSAELLPLVIHVALFADGEATPTDPAACLAHPGAFLTSKDVSAGPEGGPVEVPRAKGVKPNRPYLAVSVLEFAGDEPAPVDPTPAPVVDPTTPAA